MFLNIRCLGRNTYTKKVNFCLENIIKIINNGIQPITK